MTKSTQQRPQRGIRTLATKIRRLPARMVVGGCLVLMVSLFTVFFVCKTQLAIAAHYGAQSHKVDQPFVIELTQAVSAVESSRITISPSVEGAWVYQSGGLFGKDRLVLTPKTYFKAGTTYTVKAPDAKRMVVGSAHIAPVRFTTETAPSVAKTGAATLQANAVVAADYAFSVKLAAPNRGLRSLELRTTPEIAMIKSVQKDQTFSWRPKELLPQGAAVAVELYDTKNNVSLLKKDIKIADEPAAPLVAKALLTSKNDPMTLVFSQPIDPDSKQFIAFDAPGEGTWQNDTTYVFTPASLEPGKTYTYIIKKGLRSKAGGIVTADRTGELTTRGSVAVVGVSPGGKGLSQASQAIKFTFDQAVDHASAEQRFSISSGKVTGMQWQGSTLIATVADLGFQQTVTARVAPGVINTEFGLPSAHEFRTTFTTEIRTVKLNIPYYRQQYAASCTAASLRMILASKGIMAGDMDIVQRMGYAPRAMDKSTNPPTWDNPQEMFVGDVNGSIAAGTGAGPDAPPVAKAARSFGVNASSVTGIGVNWIAEQIHAGRSVIMFGATKAGGYTKWKTPTGAMITMPSTGHARTVTGVSGEPNAPLGFWVNDPLYGARYWSAGELAANIALDPDRQAVVVY